MIFLKKLYSSFSNIITSINNNDLLTLALVLVLTILCKTYFIFDGISDEDSAYYLLYSVDFNEAIEYNSSMFNYYLTGFVSNLFLKFFSAKLLALRILQILNYFLIFISVFFLLRRKLPNVCILCGELLSLIILCSRPLEFYYDDFSASMCILFLLFMVKGVEKSNSFYLFLSGLVYGLNIFVRIPNLAYAVLFSYLFFVSDKSVPLFRRILYVFVGFIAALLLFFLLLYVNDDCGHALNGIMGLVYTSHDTENTHNLSRMLLVVFNAVRSNLFASIKVTAIFVLVFYLGKVRRYKKLYYITVALIFVFFFLKLLYSWGKSPIDILYYYIVISTVVLTYFIFRAKEYRSLVFILLLGIYVVPLGSDYYFIVSIAYIYAAVTSPFIFFCLYKIGELGKACKLLYGSCVLISCVFVIRNYFTDYNIPFGEKSTRSERKYEVAGCDALQYIKTDSLKADRFMRKAEIIKPYLKSKSLMIGRISDLMLSVVLGKTLYNNRPKIWGTNTSVYNNAMEVYKRKHEKPDVLLSKESLKCSACPELRFMKDIGGYRKVWEDEEYELYSPVS